MATQANRRQYPNSAILFKNAHKKSSKEPDWRGEGEIDGRKYELAAWNKEGRENSQFISISFKTEEEAAKFRGNRPANDAPASAVAADDKEITF